MKRFIVIPVALVLIVSMAIPAFAADYGLLDYNDYIASTEFDGTNDNVVVKFPEDMCSIDLWRYSPPPNTRVGIVNASSAIWTLSDGEYYYTNAYPMGYSSSSADSNSRLALSNIPDGTNIHFDLTYRWLYTDDESGLIDTPTYDAWLMYYSESGIISSQQFTAGTAPGDGYPYDEDTWSFDITINKPAGATSILFYAQLDSIKAYETGRLQFSLDNFSLTFSVSALYRLQEQTGKNSVVLGDIKQQLAEQGQTIKEFVSQQEQTNEKLDNIINGDFDPVRPPNSDIVESLGDLEQDILGDVSGNIDKIEDAFDNAFDAFVSYSQSLLGAVFIFNLFADIPLVSVLLYVSLALGVLASIFGVATAIVSRGSAESKQHDRDLRSGRVGR